MLPKMAAKTWCGHVPTSTCPQARLLMYLALPKRLIRAKNEVILNPILALATSDGMKTDITPKMLRKRLGT